MLHLFFRKNIKKLTWLIFYDTYVLINELLKCNVWSQTVYDTSWTVQENFNCLNLFSSLHSMIKYQKKPNGLLIFRTKVGRFLTFLIVTMGNRHIDFFFYRRKQRKHLWPIFLKIYCEDKNAIIWITSLHLWFSVIRGFFYLFLFIIYIVSC